MTGSNNFLIDHLGLLQNPGLGNFCKGLDSKYSGVVGPTVSLATTPFCLCCTSRKMAIDSTYTKEPGRVPTKFYCQ